MNLKAIEQAEAVEASMFHQTGNEIGNGQSAPNYTWPKDDEEAMERMHKEQCELDARISASRKNSTLVYDPGERKENTVSYCEKKYGPEIAKAMYQAKKRGGQIDKAIYAEIMKISTGKGNKDKNEIQKKIIPFDKKENGQFIMVPFNLLDNANFRTNFSGKILTYLLLRRNIIRKRMKQDKLKLYENYYAKNKLAASIPIRKLGRDMGLSPTTVRKYINELKISGVVKIDKIKPHEAWDNQKHYIYVLGTHKGKDNEKYFIDEVYSDAE